MTKRKLSVLSPSASRLGDGRPTLEILRKRLGGPRQEGGPPRLLEGGIATYQGGLVLVLHEDPEADRVDLWLGEGRAVRAKGSELSPPTTTAPPALARVVASYERDRALRDELLQEVLMAIVQALPRLTDAAKLKSFVFRIAHNRSVSHITRRMRERAHEETGTDADLPTPSHEHALIQAERSERLLEAIRQLSLPYRQVMTLILEDMSYEEIADTLGITIENVGVRVNRAKKHLKERLHHD